LRFRKHGQGKEYPFSVGVRQSRSYRLVHEERPFICDRCALAWLRRNACLALLCWVPPFLIAAAGVLRLAFRVYTEGNPFRVAYLPAVGGLSLLGFGLLALAGLVVRMAWRQLRGVRPGRWLQDRFPDPAVTRMAIALRKKDLLQALDLSGAQVMFLTQGEHAAKE
jgi:hypothetical protein